MMKKHFRHPDEEKERSDALEVKLLSKDKERGRVTLYYEATGWKPVANLLKNPSTVMIGVHNLSMLLKCKKKKSLLFASIFVYLPIFTSISICYNYSLNWLIF